MRFLIIAIVLLTSLSCFGRTRTTQTGLRGDASIAVERIAVADSVACELDSLGLHSDDVTLRGYGKRAGDNHETFLVTNNTRHRISRVKLLLRYTTLAGEMIHEREVVADVLLAPGETRLATVRSFDPQHAYYYYAGNKPRKRATPYKVAFRLLGYDVPVGR